MQNPKFKIHLMGLDFNNRVLTASLATTQNPKEQKRKTTTHKPES